MQLKCLNCKRVELIGIYTLSADFLEGSYGRPEPNPSDEAAGTAMIRIFVQTDSLKSAKVVFRCLQEFALGMQHYSGEVTRDAILIFLF
jgi:hypothetical protein